MAVTAALQNVNSNTEFMYTINTGDGTGASSCTYLGMSDTSVSSTVGALSATLVGLPTYKTAGAKTISVSFYRRFPLTDCPEGKAPAATATVYTTTTSTVTVRDQSISKQESVAGHGAGLHTCQLHWHHLMPEPAKRGHQAHNHALIGEMCT